MLKRLFRFIIFSLRSRRLEVVGERENGRARGRHACLLLARSLFSCAHYFQVFIFCSQTVHMLILTTVVQKVDSTDHFTSLKNCPSTPPLGENQHLLFTQPGKLLPQGRGRWAVCQKRISSEYTFIQWIRQYDSVTLIALFNLVCSLNQSLQQRPVQTLS